MTVVARNHLPTRESPHVKNASFRLRPPPLIRRPSVENDHAARFQARALGYLTGTHNMVLVRSSRARPFPNPSLTLV